MVGISFYGTSFFRFEDKGCIVLVDPYLNRDIPKLSEISAEKIMGKTKKPVLVLVTHEHFDHFDKELITALLSRPNTFLGGHDHLLNQIESVPKYRKRSLETNKPMSMYGVSVKPIPVHHPNSFDPWGYEINFGGTVIFHSGDTHLSKAFNEVKANVLILPIGGNNTMDVVDAVRAVKTMKPDIAIPMNYGSNGNGKAFQEEFCEKIKKSILKTKTVVLKPCECFNIK